MEPIALLHQFLDKTAPQFLDKTAPRVRPE
jgi:hypothetical protein